MKGKRIWIMVFVMASILSLLFLLKTPPVAAQTVGTSGIPWMQPARLLDLPAHAKMNSVLSRLAEILRTEGIDKARAYARARRIELRNDCVQVVAQSANESTGQMSGSQAFAVQAVVQGLGGAVELSHGRSFQCWVPIYSLLTLAEDPRIESVRLPLHPRILATSEGLGRIGALDWANIAPYHPGSRKIKICILDAGFKNFRALLGTELPAQVTVQSFRADRDIEAHEHGAACAEIVYDIAPQAEFYLVNFDTDVEHHLAVDWIISQGIDIVSYSIGWYNAGDGKGTGPIDEDIKRAAASGVIWVAAAGNEADSHWEGTFNDPDGNGFNNFSGGDEKLEFITSPGYMEMVFLNWDDWGTWNGTSYTPATQDYDLYLYYLDGAVWKSADTSLDLQNGTPGKEPSEAIYGWYSPYYSVHWAVSIKKRNASRNVKLELFIPEHSDPLEYLTPEGSLAVGADSPDAITVGANSWEDDSYHYYSSRGPTHDNRIKPDLCAPSGVSTRTYGTMGFYGTSASTPHVAGAFGLLLAKTSFSKEDIRKIVFARAVDLGAIGPDNLFGYYGRLNLKK